MTETTLVVALIGEKAGRSPIISHLEKMQPWQISWRWSAQLPEDTTPFDIGIIYTVTANLEPQIANIKLPLILITDPEDEISAQSSTLEKIPRHQLNTFALKITIRLLLQTSQNPKKTNEATTHSIPEDIVISLSPEGKIRSWNQGAVDFFGYHSEDVCGDDYVTLFVAPGDRPTFRQQLQVALQDIAVVNYQHTVITHNAIPFTLSGQLKPLKQKESQQIKEILCTNRPNAICALNGTEGTNPQTQTLTISQYSNSQYSNSQYSNSPHPVARDHQEQIHFTQTLAQFSRVLSNPDSTSTLSTALGLFGKTLGVQRVTILKWHHRDQCEAYPPVVVEQWSADQSPPCHEKLMHIPLAYWGALLKDSQPTNIYNRDDVPDLAAQLADLNIASLIAFPIKDTVGQLWGYLIFSGDRPVARPYSTFVRQTLQMATELIHHYLQRIFAQRELEASETLYSGIVLHSAEAIFLLRVDKAQDFVFEMVNPTYCELVNFYTHQIIGKTPKDIFSAPVAAQILKSCRTCLKVGEAIFTEETLPLPHGERIWRTSFVPIRDRQGRITHVQGSSRDITEERQLEYSKISQTRHRHLLTSLTLRVLESWQTDKMLATTVTELRNALNVDRVIFFELQDQKSGIVIHEAAIATVPKMINQSFAIEAFDRGDFRIFQQGEIQTCIDVIAEKFPTAHHQLLSNYAVKTYAVLPVISAMKLDANGEPSLKGLLCIQQCHHKKIWTADELHFFRQLTNQISIALNQAELLRQQKHYTKELARSNKELEQFAYIASHDLQEPLQIVSNYAQLLEKRSAPNLDERSLRYIFHIVEETKRMQQQIQDLLQYSRLNTRKKTFQLVNLKCPLKQAIANLQIKIKNSQAQITLPQTFPEIYGDQSNLQNLWQNLLSNALKYRSKNPPKITITIEKSEDKWLCKVQDNGIGIDPQHQGRIFQLFQRLHTQEEYPGTGIGLAICQRIVQQHDGKIWLDSDVRQGSTFIFTLPAINSAKILR
ncbi:ATP-binding protein [[Limnothrix rosea] IAM M-220]|uniref:ATP-binding protein n=1 Tax=[Limnothrix rosea] IAM M-220 TaxID=454133 RepID=UPI0009596DD8|nr:ATP-binding protein [[Limnothrix rosea] IAM M-220]OKH19421.1 hypothetical protein NIES208_02605 [[Limnothrix rosea] IAM M-220]